MDGAACEPRLRGPSVDNHALTRQRQEEQHDLGPIELPFAEKFFYSGGDNIPVD